MNKEECIDGCIINLEFQIKNCEDYGHSDVYLDVYDAKNILSIIKEHFELKRGIDEIIKMSNKYINTTYKLEDLKVGMWVWDTELKRCWLIRGVYGNEIHFAFDNFKNYITKFEENRFFPVQKANDGLK